MKAILLSIRPEHAVNILNGKKTLEIRKSVPKDFVGWVYGYVTKGKPFLMHAFDNTYYSHDMTEKYRMKNDLNGTIPFRFWFDEYEELYFVDSEDDYKLTYDFGIYYDYDEEIFSKLCLTKSQVYNYGKGKNLYAWHIKKLDIFSKPMQLSEFYKDGFEQCEYSPFDYDNDLETCLDRFRIKRAPQSFQYVWVKE
jgi:predicted transcriptional regulator